MREHFFGADPVLLERVAHLSDEQIGALHRGGHDPAKVYAAYAAALRHTGRPTVILAKTVKGYGMGAAGEAANTNHQQKKMADPAVRAFRDRFSIPVPDDQLEQIPYIAGARQRRAGLFRRGHPARGRPSAAPSGRPRPAGHAAAGGLRLVAQEQRGPRVLDHAGLVRLLGQLLKDPGIGKRVVPIVPDESRTFGMDAMFRQVGIYSHVGQLYTPQDADQLNVYREDRQGQILQEGINESGAMASWIAAPRRTARMGWRRSRSTSSIRCSASSAWATWPGPPATSARAVSSWARPRAAPRWKARACSTTTATATCWPR